MKIEMLSALALLILLGSGTPLQAVGPREPLTSKDFGLYGGWSEYAVSSSSPFSYLIIQALADKDAISSHETTNKEKPSWNDWLKRARANGKRVIADVTAIAKDNTGKARGFHAVSKNPILLESYKAAFDSFLQNVDVENLYAITIGEEHVFWNGQEENLQLVYDYLKERYKVPVYQWWSPSSKGSVPGLNWPNIRADGWVADEYFLTQPDMEIAMRGYTLLQKPVFQILFASSSRFSSLAWSEKRFWEQYSVCLKYNIPMAFFCWSGRQSTPSNKWGWAEDASPEMRDIFQNFCVKVATATNAPPPVVDLDWDIVPWKQKKNIFKLESSRQKFLTYQEIFSKKRGLAFMGDARVSGFSNLNWDSSPLQLRPRTAGPAAATLNYLFECPKNADSVTVKAIGHNYGGTVECGLTDERDNILAQAELSSDMASLTYDMRKYPGNTFKTFFRMKGQAPRPGIVLAELSSLMVEVKCGMSADDDLKNMLINPSFEKTDENNLPLGWSEKQNGEGCSIEIEREKRYSGDTALKITNSGAGGSCSLRSSKFDVEPGKNYSAEGFYLNSEGRVAIYLEFFDRNGKCVYKKNVWCPSGVGQWRPVKVAAIAPEAATTGDILIFSPSKIQSMFYADDFFISVSNIQSNKK